MPGTAVMLLTCPDRPGVVAAVANFIAAHGGNIVYAEQHTDAVEGIFFQRVEFALDGLDLPREDILDEFRPVAEQFAMEVDLRFTDQRQRLVLLASKQPHCLYDLLTRWRTGELAADTMAAATVRARIPMAPGVDSLNAAAASAIACYALRPRG